MYVFSAWSWPPSRSKKILISCDHYMSQLVLACVRVQFCCKQTQFLALFSMLLFRVTCLHAQKPQCSCEMRHRTGAMLPFPPFFLSSEKAKSRARMVATEKGLYVPFAATFPTPKKPAAPGISSENWGLLNLVQSVMLLPHSKLFSITI